MASSLALVVLIMFFDFLESNYDDRLGPMQSLPTSIGDVVSRK